MLARLRVDLDAILANLAALRAFVEPARLAAVIKGNAYGHGLVPVGRAVAAHVDRLCVYELEEAAVLRDAGIDTRIHVLGPIPVADLELAHALGVQITLWDRGAYAADAAAVARRQGSPLRVQVKVDTGVTRLGLTSRHAPTAIAHYQAQPEFHLTGVFSHLAAAEELDSSFTREQLERFEAATAGIPPGVERHIAATAAALLWPQTRLDVVRAGIGVYGIWPSRPTQEVMRGRGLALRPALRWETHVVLVHAVAAQTSVGYGCTYRTARASRIGVLPIGYFEGLPRSVSNRGFVIVDGRRAPIVGRVCMNMTFIDLTDHPASGAGSVVTLIGTDGAESIDAEEAAGWAGTIAYELVARLPAQIARVYVHTAQLAGDEQPLRVKRR